MCKRQVLVKAGLGTRLSMRQSVGFEAGRRVSVFALSPDQVFRKGKQPPDILAQQCDKDSTSTAKFK